LKVKSKRPNLTHDLIWRKRDLLRLGMSAGFFVSGDRYVELSRQIRAGLVVHEHLSKFLDHRAGIKELVVDRSADQSDQKA